MNTFMLRLLPLAPILALAGTLLTEREPARKCGPQPPGGPIYFINGVVVPGMTQERVRAYARNAFTYDTLCMDAQDSTLYKWGYPPGPRYGVTSIWTKDGPGPHVLLALDYIRFEQDAHRRVKGTYIADVKEIVLPLGMERVRVTLKADDKGWIAHTTIPRFMQTCTMFDGIVADPAPAVEPRRFQCKFDEKSTP